MEFLVENESEMKRDTIHADGRDKVPRYSVLPICSASGCAEDSGVHFFRPTAETRYELTNRMDSWIGI